MTPVRVGILISLQWFVTVYMNKQKRCSILILNMVDFFYCIKQADTQHSFSLCVHPQVIVLTQCASNKYQELLPLIFIQVVKLENMDDG